MEPIISNHNLRKLPQAKPCLVGESPHWDAANQILYWVDIYGKGIFKYDAKHHSVTSVTLPEMVGHAIPISDNIMIITMPSGIYHMQISTQELERICALEPHLPNNRPNDGKRDPEGRLWVGTIDLEFKPGLSSLYRLDPNGHLTRVLKDLTLANGMAWDMQNNIFYFVDSGVQAIQKFKYHPKSGELTEGTTAFKYDKSLGIPDGICIDQESMLWVAGFGGGNVGRFNPETGQLLQKIQLPTPYPTACTLGGKNGNQLFITTASHLANAHDLESGFTYVINLDDDE